MDRRGRGNALSALAVVALLAALLPTGERLDAVRRTIAVGNMPLNMIASPEGNHLLVLLSGWRDQGIQVIDIASGRVEQFVPLKSSFLGLAFSPDGKTVYASGGNDDLIHLFTWTGRQLEPQRQLSQGIPRFARDDTSDLRSDVTSP